MLKDIAVNLSGRAPQDFAADYATSMAAAFGLPVVVFFGPSEREVWAPWRTASQVLPVSAEADDAIAALERLRVAA